ncbi:hypothetical protein IWQ47_005069 [Aquimarina sp. EL_43]|uniref:hypothetical protein n=1 Tax=unclassified Aquimarina TaxID=2627091 RepID=UPI0018C95B67|nr:MULTISPECIES: hypothetical protein [unclassified Aquimarina]MBG6133578.1 hypothetical protein [Aquimarina sp. EL_35]MBG6153796.1 hypothetical protein [Aquimarina sp. EL_32]MBG6171970.1 hypothetical protein [Aquimarina sp. EL_43]
MKHLLFYIVFCYIIFLTNSASAQKEIFPGADENTPSKAQYFSWINNTNEGTTEEHSLINLDFFKWLKDEYNMQLDIYAFDAGAIDGKRFYGSIYSDRFKKQFPNGFDPIHEKATELGVRLGVWGGPDGFGNTPEEEKQRTEQMVKLCKDYNFALFKFDAVCGPLRPEKENAFIHMMEQCRKHSPDLILLNHRLGFEKAQSYATTFLWEGAETYVDVFMNNNTTAPHHRAAALSRGLVPNLQRLTEDHGVCISSCLDYWEDDLVLQAFNRSLILSPQIYGNPWLLRDNEFPKLARIFNIHKKYKNILVDGIALPKNTYGVNTVSRGNQHTRIITLRNLSWLPKKYKITVGEELGLRGNKPIKIIQLHPNEQYIGTYSFNDSVNITVPSFRSTLLIATTEDYEDPIIYGSPFQVIRNVEEKPVLIDLIGKPGTEAILAISNPENYEKIELNGAIANELLLGKKQKVHFPGKILTQDTHRKIAEIPESVIPEDANVLYEATVYSADNNALEVRSLFRSGETNIPQVQNARDAFFNQKVFKERGIWDKNLFDSDLKTGFWKSKKYSIDQSVKGGTLRLDLGEITSVDELILKIPDDFSLQPLLTDEGNYVEVSKDLKSWKQIMYLATTESHIPIYDDIRYLRFKKQPQRIVEIEGYYQQKPLDRSKWKASNLFAYVEDMKPVKAWKTSFTLTELANNSYLSVALNGKHGIEGAYVAAKIGDQYIGAPDRAVSYPSNTWEYVNARRDHDYTYYIPLKESYVNKKIEVFVLGYDKENIEILPEVWISSMNPNEKIGLKLYRK